MQTSRWFLPGLVLLGFALSGCQSGPGDSGYSYTSPVPVSSSGAKGKPRTAKPATARSLRFGSDAINRNAIDALLSDYTLIPGSPPPAPAVASMPMENSSPWDFLHWRKSAAESDGNTEAYASLPEIPFRTAKKEPLSTFSIDVDTASYANVRRMLQGRDRVPPGAVRLEEMINYFTYDYPEPAGDQPFSVNTAVAACPWQDNHRLVRIGLRGRELPRADRPASNLVFLVDVSGSMQDPAKLPLVQSSLRLLLDELQPSDRVALAVYAGEEGLVLPSTPVSERKRIRKAIDQLGAGGSTNGGAGITLAYRIARENLLSSGNNRVILATDGDFNVGLTDESSLTDLIRREAKSGVFLSVLGFGMGNLKDSTLETLADKGNGNYAYIDTLREAKKVLVREMGSSLFTIARDVKIQVEFNPAQVAAWRLLGYENRVMAHEDFADDSKDAGEIGAGHRVTALYEIVPAGQPVPVAEGPDLKYTTTPTLTPAAATGELLTVKLRYQTPRGGKSRLITQSVPDSRTAFAAADPEFRFATAVAAFGMKLRNSPHAASIQKADIIRWARGALGRDPHGDRAEFVSLAKKLR